MFERMMLGILLLLISLPIHAQDNTTPTPTPPLVFPSPTPIQTETPTATPTRGVPTHTPTPRPDVPDYIYDWREELLYPVAVHFFLVIDRPLDAILDVRLVITVEGEIEPRILEFGDIRTYATVTEPFTEFNVIWRIPPDNPLRLNVLVNYEWQVRLSETQITTIPGVFAYRNPQAEWILDVDPQNRLDLLMPLVNNLTPDVLRQRLNPIYERLAQNTGRTPRFRVMLENAQYPFDPCISAQTITNRQGDIETPCDATVLNSYLRQIGYTRLTGQASLSDQLIPYLVESFYAPLWANSEYPAWFKQGILLMYTPTDKQYALENVKEASRTNTLFSLDEMTQLDETRPELWRSQSYVMTLYMAQRIGFSGLFDFARAQTTSETPISFAQRYQTVMNAPLEALLPTLNNWIFTLQAESASAVTIYGDPTPVPSPTPSVTPFPPTATPTFTDTPTNTPTATVTGVQTATPIPSLTPTNTPIVTPSVTPRPAGFRDTPPPLPTLPPLEAQPTPFPPIEGDIQATTDSGVMVTLILGLALLGLAILFGMYWFTERKSS